MGPDLSKPAPATDTNDPDVLLAEEGAVDRRTAGLARVRRFLRDPMAATGLVLVLCMVSAALLAGLIAPHDPIAIATQNRLLPPSADHLLGTDQLGRDLLSRVLYGGRVALQIAAICIGSALLIGVTLGMLAGYGPRWLDNLLLLVFDVVRSFPVVILALVMITLTGPSLQTVIAVIIVGKIPNYARIVRAQTLAIRNSTFILAEQSMGIPLPRVLFVHVLPNVIGPVFILASMDIPVVVTIEAGLSFLGLGVRPPAPSWGTILNDGFSFIQVTIWPIVAGSLPLIAITLGFTFLGEALRDEFDPKTRAEQ